MPDPLSTPVRPSTRAAERPAGPPAAHESPDTPTGRQTPAHGVRLSASQITDDDLDVLYDQRDQARRIAVALEQQLAAVAALHVDSHTTRGVGRATDTPPDHWTPYCEHDGQDWPCATVRALNPEEQPASAGEGGAA